MKTRLKHPSQYPIELHKKIIESLAKKGNVFYYAALKLSIIEIASELDLRMSTTKAKFFIQYYISQKYLEKKYWGVYAVSPC